jgi:hypothetical protein
MILFSFAWASHSLHGANSAVVCSTPPSCVGTGMEEVEDSDGWVRGRKYMYICVVKRFGKLDGVTHLVKGIRESIEMLAIWCYVGLYIESPRKI